MKKFTKICVLALVLALSLTVLCGCDDNESIYGKWTSVYKETEADTRALVEALGFYEEELALIDMNSLESVNLVQFNEDKTYEMGLDPKGCQEKMAKFMDGVVTDLYEGRASLTSLYGEEIVDATKEEFQMFYAELFGFGTYEELLNDLVDYESLALDNEVGTYNAALGNIYFTMEGQSQAENAPYEVKGGKLIITFADMVVEYTKE